MPVVDGWFVDFSSDPPSNVNWPSQVVSVDRAQLVIGLANGWAGSPKCVLMMPEQLAAAWVALGAIGYAPRGAMFWDIPDEGDVPVTVTVCITHMHWIEYMLCAYAITSIKQNVRRLYTQLFPDIDRCPGASLGTGLGAHDHDSKLSLGRCHCHGGADCCIQLRNVRCGAAQGRDVGQQRQQ